MVRIKGRARGSRTSISILVNVVDNKEFSGYNLINVLLVAGIKLQFNKPKSCNFGARRGFRFA